MESFEDELKPMLTKPRDSEFKRELLLSLEAETTETKVEDTTREIAKEIERLTHDFWTDYRTWHTIQPFEYARLLFTVAMLPTLTSTLTTLFRALEKEKEERKRSPFSLSFAEFQNLKLDDAKRLLREVHGLCKSSLEEAWGRDVRQAVICDGKIVFESKDIEDIPNETVESLGKKYSKACYVFSAPDIVEESNWTPVRNDDFYPTLCVYLGAEDLAESQIVKSSSPIDADLDTGNPSYKVFDANQLAEQLATFAPTQMRQGIHLGEHYTYFSKRVKMCVVDISGNINSVTYSVRLVEDWDGCALLQVSPNRKGFIGRDILRDLRVRIELDPLKKITQILSVS